jgi:hypothetical protein
VKDHDLAADDSAIEHPGNAFCGLETELEQAVAHGTSMRHAEIRTVYLHPLGVAQKPGDKPGG